MNGLKIFTAFMTIVTSVLFVLILLELREINKKLKDRVTIPIEDYHRQGHYLIEVGRKDWMNQLTKGKEDTIINKTLSHD